MMSSDFRQVFLPYCLDQQADGSYVVTNRRYKPVGDTRTGYVEYGGLPVRVRFKNLTAAAARRLDCQGRDRLDRIYLYNDGCIPNESKDNWDAYSLRLQLLASLDIEPA